MSRDLAAARTREEVARAASAARGRGLRRADGRPRARADRERARARAGAPGASRRRPRGRGRPVGFRPRPDGRPRHRHPPRRFRALCVPLRGTQAVLGRPRRRAPTRRSSRSGRTSATCWRRSRGRSPSGLERARLAEEAQQARVAAEARAAAQHAAELGVPRPADAARHDHRRREQPPRRTPRSATARGASSQEAIYEEAVRLNRLVTNLLDMTRLESGTLQLNRDWHSAGGARRRRPWRASSPRLKGRAVRTRVPPDLPLVPVDGVLVEQALVNLLENARRSTPIRRARSRSTARARGRLGAWSRWRTRGPASRAGTEERVFEKFYRAESAGAGASASGLPICRAIATAHGGHDPGREPRSRAGTRFRFTLPLGGRRRPPRARGRR